MANTRYSADVDARPASPHLVTDNFGTLIAKPPTRRRRRRGLEGLGPRRVDWESVQTTLDSIASALYYLEFTIDRGEVGCSMSLLGRAKMESGYLRTLIEPSDY